MKAKNIALLRGINVGGNKRVPMAQLRELAAELGWHDVTTYIQSGNIVFRAGAKSAALERALENAIEEHFGFSVPVIVRTATAWRRYASKSPFADAERERPNLLHLGFAKKALPKDVAKTLAPYCKNGERIMVKGDAIWIDCVGGVARSKLTPAVLDRGAGSTVTMRNWKTVQAVAAML